MAKKELSFSSRNYKSFLKEIKTKILSARLSAARRINKELIKLYWDIGKPRLGCRYTDDATRPRKHSPANRGWVY